MDKKERGKGCQYLRRNVLLQPVKRFRQAFHGNWWRDPYHFPSLLWDTSTATKAYTKDDAFPRHGGVSHIKIPPLKPTFLSSHRYNWILFRTTHSIAHDMGCKGFTIWFIITLFGPLPISSIYLFIPDWPKSWVYDLRKTSKRTLIRRLCTKASNQWIRM